MGLLNVPSNKLSPLHQVTPVIGTTGAGVADDGSEPVKIGAVGPGGLVRTFAVDSVGRLVVLGSGLGDTASQNVGLVATDDGTYPLAVVPLLWDGATLPRKRTPSVVKTVAAVAIVAGTPAAVWTPAAGKKFRLMGWALSSSAAASLIFKDAATERLRTPLLAAAGVSEVAAGFGNGVLSAAANNVLNLDVSAGTTVSGYLFGTEE